MCGVLINYDHAFGGLRHDVVLVQLRARNAKRQMFLRGRIRHLFDPRPSLDRWDRYS